MDQRERDEYLRYYFSNLGDGYFIEALEEFSNRDGFGIGEIGCGFADNYEPWEEDYFGKTGVAFYFDYPAVKEDITLILDEETFYMYLIKASENYLARYPDEEQIVKELLAKIKNNLKFPGSK